MENKYRRTEMINTSKLITMDDDDYIFLNTSVLGNRLHIKVPLLTSTFS